MVQPSRRVVAGHDAAGRSVIWLDGAAANVNVFEAAGGTAVTELWSTATAPASNAGSEDAGAAPFVLEPPPTGTRFRIVEYPPDSVRFASGDRAAGYRQMGAARHMVTDRPRHPGMHKTASVDYAVVLDGEIWAVMDEGETLLKAGDCLVQRGTSHAWSNRTDKPARVAFVLVGAEPV